MQSLKQIKPMKKRPTYRKTNTPYMSISLKMLYINEDAAALVDQLDYCTISIDTKGQHIVVHPANKEDDGAFKLSTVCESKRARRIETNRALLSFIRSGFPMWMLDKRLPVVRGLDGSLIADYSMKIPTKEIKEA